MSEGKADGVQLMSVQRNGTTIGGGDSSTYPQSHPPPPPVDSDEEKIKYPGPPPSISDDEHINDSPLDDDNDDDDIEHPGTLLAGSDLSSSTSVDEHITECANVWSLVGFAISTSYTAIHLAFAITHDPTYVQFYSWVILPICGTAMAVSLALKPRR